MKTIEMLNDMIAENVETYRATARALREARDQITSIYNEGVAAGKTPKETIISAIKALGEEPVRDVIATLTICAGWDGRISRAAKEWAYNSGNGWDEEAAEKLWLRTSQIHPAHLSQLAEACGSIRPDDLIDPEEVDEAVTEEVDEEVKALETLDTVETALKARKDRSAWNKGVTVYALELLESLRESIEGGYFFPDDLAAPKVLAKTLLNGASDWNEYSWGGSALIYDSDIAERLCNPSELKKTRNGERRPNAREDWLDCQARALFQAAHRLTSAIRSALNA